MSIKDGGSAFPVPGTYIEAKHGMTLRDYFAAAAMQGMLAAGEGYSTTDLCEYAYDVADEMLSRRDAK